MRDESLAFLKEMEETPSVTGFEQPVARIIRKRMGPFADGITTDVHGNVTAVLNPKGVPKVMLAGHMDQIGLMVRHIDDQGFIYFSAVGGVDASVLPGTRVTVHNKRGPVEGVIGRKPIHLMKEDERNKTKIELTDLWLDIGVSSKEQALQRVAIADPVTYRLGMTRLGEDLITSPGLDNKVGAFVVMEALRLAKERGIKCALYAVATVAEEIGLRGARTSCFDIDPLVGIAADVTHATDNPGADKKQAGDIALGKGAVIDLGANINPVLGELFVKTAQEEKIPHQICAAPGATGTDANAIQISRSGVAAGLISIPNRYMHTQVEVCSLTDLESCANLIAATLARITAETSFIPL
jgi:tetrahedral aminopeptidase